MEKPWARSWTRKKRAANSQINPGVFDNMARKATHGKKTECPNEKNTAQRKRGGQKQ